MIKEKVKALWKLCFDDNDEFVEMYFRLRYNNEVNVALQSNGEVISALQMIPYPMTFCGKTIQTSYISGACTHPDYRDKGAMRELLSETFAKMKRNGASLSTLIPAEPWLFDYYAHRGYAPVFNYSKREVALKDVSATTGVRIQTINTSTEEEAYRYLNRKMSERPCCIQHTPADFNVILADVRISQGAVYIARQKEEIRGIAFAYPKDYGWQIDELFAENEDIEKALLYRILQDTEQSQISVITPPKQNENENALGMARIIDAETILQQYAAAYPEIQMSIELTDHQIETNNAFYYLRNGQCKVSAQQLPGSHQQLTIRELCELVFSPLHPYMSLMLN